MWWRRLRYLLLLLALCAIATCPAAKRSCSARNHAREAEQLLDYLGDRVAERVATTGKVPALAAGPTPVPSCCDQGGTCDPDAAAWATPGWTQLAFSIDNPYRYTYAYVPDPGGDSATVRATGDLDCDGISALYELKLTVAGMTVIRSLTRKDPYE